LKRGALTLETILKRQDIELGAEMDGGILKDEIYYMQLGLQNEIERRVAGTVRQFCTQDVDVDNGTLFKLC